MSSIELVRTEDGITLSLSGYPRDLGEKMEGRVRELSVILEEIVRSEEHTSELQSPE